ncbi:preprotein translocase subunit YajC [Staphylococcus epidermidis]|uniref:preprotein translocase subunit YajC n=1 Tax=Staphylococcus epidermidis TaxID=1282 RepID=UPI0011A9459E|nr:preprotein translocase subunit YajC [Staphylococcus epidermidis]
MYLLLIRPQEKGGKEDGGTIKGVEGGEKISRMGGIKGSIKGVDETCVMIRVNSNGREMSFEKRGIK